MTTLKKALGGLARLFCKCRDGDICKIVNGDLVCTAPTLRSKWPRVLRGRPAVQWGYEALIAGFYPLANGGGQKGWDTKRSIICGVIPGEHERKRMRGKGTQVLRRFLGSLPSPAPQARRE